MLFTLQRYEFFSKSQQRQKRIRRRFWCCLPYKGTNFSANHNRCFALSISVADVVYPTKVRIFQQITTQWIPSLEEEKMLFTLQRYEFFSKSQPHEGTSLAGRGCCLPYKGTNFSANHNCTHKINARIYDVVYPTKVRIFQQITTWSRKGKCV